ncbi:MAG: hypothetical protein ABEK50_11300, partial [bacterium]
MKRLDLWSGAFLLTLYGLAALYLAPYYFDDAFITFRYVANLAEGYGYVYNPGEYVEGASNLLWALILVPFHWLPVSLPNTAAWLGGLLYGGLLLYLLRTFLGEAENPVSVILAVLLPLVAVPIGPLWSISGLEVSLYLLLLTAGLITGGPVSLLLAALTRPEGIAFLVVLPLLKRTVTLKRYTLALV